MLGLILAALLVHEGNARVEFNAKSTEVVIAPDAPATVRFAASEMTNFLSRAFGASVPVVQGFTNGRTAIVLGDNEWTRQAGIDVRKLPRDGFSLRIGKSRVFIAGRDDPKRDLFRDARSGNVWATLYEHATLFGVYEFLERYAGCRFYFPGRIGEAVPRRASVRVDGGGFDMSPDFIVRRYLAESDGFWFNDDGSDGPKNHPDKSLNWLRLRMQTFNIPCSHGQRAHEITKRFADTHPEYFWLRPDGTRCTNRTSRATGEWDIHQLCQSSAVRDEIYKDVVSYLKGEPPSVRRIPNRWKRRPDQPDYAWPISMNGNYIDIMPQDGYRRCCCEKCRVRYVDDENFASEFLWEETAKFANRLTADGFTNAVVTMMAYRPYRRIPDVDIPSNVRVMVAETGPWTLNNPSVHRRDCDEVCAWAKKVKFGKVWLWYYPHKSGLAGIPQFSPRAQGEYIKSLAPSLFGYFAESESDRFLFNFLNYYTVAKVAWDNRTDVGALLDEHYEKMYGPAAPEMKDFFETLERKWVYEIQGRIVENEMGPICFPPSEYDLFTKVFSPDMLKDLESFLDVAAKKVGRNTVEAERVWFMRNAFFKSLKFKSEVVLAATDVAAERKRRAAVRPKNLYPFPDEAYELATTNTQVIHRDLQAGSLKPETRYRVSFFAKLDNVVPKKRWGSGIYLWADDAGGEHADSGNPEYLSGTTPWIHTSFVFTTGKTPGRSRRPFVRFCAAAVAGRCTIKDVLLEEL